MLTKSGMKSRYPVQAVLLSLLLLLSISCAKTGDTDNSKSITPPPLDSQDRSCAYFYYLWGNHSESNRKYKEAIDAYEKALLCDPYSSMILEKLVVVSLRIGNEAKAALHLQKLVTEQQGTISQNLLLARLLARLGQLDKAAQRYQYVLKREPNNETARLQLGLLYTIEKKYAKAEETFLSVTRMKPESYPASLYLAKLYGEMDNVDRAILWYNKALLLNPSSELMDEIAIFCSHHQRYDDLARIYSTVLQKYPANEAANLGLAQTHFVQGKDEQAISHLLKLKQTGSPSHRYDLMLGRYYFGNNNLEKARLFLLSSFEQKETSELRYLLALLSVKQERREEALELLSKIDPDDPEYDNAVQLDVMILRSMGRVDDAVEKIVQKMDNKERTQPEDYLLLSDLFQEQKKMARAIEILEESLKQFKKNELILFELGLLYEKTGKSKQAMSTMQNLLRINGNHPQALNYIGYTWADNNIHLEQALEYIKRAVHLLPENGYIQDSLGWVYYRLGNLDKARAILEKAISLAPGDPLIHDHLGDVHRGLGNNNKAIESYTNALKFFQDEKKKQLMRQKIESIHEKTENNSS